MPFVLKILAIVLASVNLKYVQIKKKIICLYKLLLQNGLHLRLAELFSLAKSTTVE